MGDTSLIYRQKLSSAISEARRHIDRIDSAFLTLSQAYSFPISIEAFHRVDTWFELREIRNALSHEYDENAETGRTALNSIFGYKDELKGILSALEQVLSS